MLAIITALLPIFLVIATGYLLMRTKVIEETIWSAVSHLCHYLLFPALVIKTLSTSSLTDIPLARFATAILIYLLVVALLLLASKPLVRKLFAINNSSFTSVFQGISRWHAFVALSLAGSLYHDEGLKLMSIVIAVIVPTLQTLNVIVLVSFANEKFDFKRVISSIVTNPILIAALTGIILSLTVSQMPEQITRTLEIIGRGALGLSLMSVGAAFRFKMPKSDLGVVAFATISRLVIVPLIALATCHFMGIDGLARSIIVISGAVPTAAGAYVLARQMGGDAPLMANIITAQVITATFTLPLAIWASQL